MAAITMFRGDTQEIDLAITLNGVAVDLTGSTLTFSGKTQPGLPDSMAAWKKVSPHADIVITAPTSGIAKLFIRPTDTNSLYGVNALYYDAQLKTTGNDVYTVDSGVITINQDITLT